MSDVRKLAKTMVRMESNQRRAGSGPQLAHSSLEDGAIEEYNLDGTLVASYGKQWDGSHIAAPLVGPTPAQPVPATVEVGALTVSIRWNGKFVNDAVSTMDHKHVAVHIVEDPSEPLDQTNHRGVIVGELGDAFTTAVPAGLYWVGLVAWTEAGRHSAPSDIVPFEMKQLVDDTTIAQALEDSRQALNAATEEADAQFAALEQKTDTARTDLDDARTRLATAESTLAPLPGEVDAAKQSASEAANAALAAEARATEANNRAMTRLANGNFEEGLRYWKPGPTLSATAHSGSQSALLTPNNTLMPETNLPVVAGQIWELQAFYRPADSTALASKLAFEFMHDGATPSTTLKTASAMEWTNSGAIRLTVPDGVDSMGLRIRPVAGSWNVDDVVLRDVTDVVRLEQAAQAAKKAGDDAAEKARLLEIALNGIDGRLKTAEGNLTAVSEQAAEDLSALDEALRKAFEEADAALKVEAASDATAKANNARTAAEAEALRLAEAKADAARSAAEAAAAADALSKANAARDAAVASASNDATSKADAAREAAKTAAAADAKAKADAAKAAAISAAAADAKIKADAAQAEALRLAKLDATAKADAAMTRAGTAETNAKAEAKRLADAAEAAAKTAAAADATAKANAAETAAKNAAAADAKAKADAAKAAAEAAAKTYADTVAAGAEADAIAAAAVDAKAKADAAEAAAKAAAATDAQAKAAAAQAAAIAASAADATTKANAAKAAAEAAAKTYSDGLPKVLHGTTAPSGTAPNGSVWFQHDGSLSGAVTGQWNRVSGQWVSTPIRSEAIANLDVGKLTAGSAAVAELVTQKLLANEAVIKRLTVGVQAWIDGVLIKNGTVEAKHITVTDDLITNFFAANRTLINEELVVRGNLIANNATIISAALKNLSVTEKATFASAFADEMFAKMAVIDRLTAGSAWVGGAQLKDGAITAKHITASESLTAKVAEFLKVKAGMIEANAIDGMTITGALLQTLTAARRGVKIVNDGLHAWDAAGNETVRVNGVDNLLTGRVQTNRPGEAGIILVPRTSTGSPGIWLSESGSALGGDAAIYMDANGNMNLRGKIGPNGAARIRVDGGLEATSGGVLVGGYGVFSDGSIEAKSMGGFGSMGSWGFSDSGLLTSRGALLNNNTNALGLLYNQGHVTTGSAANVFINASSGLMARSTSARKYKADIQTAEVSDELLDLDVSTWVDKGEEAERQDLSNRMGPLTEQETLRLDELSAPGRQRNIGMIADDVADIDPRFTTFDPEGEVDGLAYDRLGVALFPITRRLRDRVSELEAENAMLSDRLDRLEAQLGIPTV